MRILESHEYTSSLHLLSGMLVYKERLDWNTVFLGFCVRRCGAISD